MATLKKSIEIDSSQQNVWNAIVSYRKSQPHRRRVISAENGRAVVEESFTGLPMVGESRVVYEEIETPFDRIEFRMLEAEHISQFQGNWTLAADTSTNSKTIVELTVEFDIDLQLPFKDVILNQLADMDVAKRIAYVKNTAESVND